MHDDSDIGPALALRDGPWKLIVSSALVTEGKLKAIGLYNLDENPMEKAQENKVSDPAQSDRVASMSKTLQRIFDEGFDEEIIYKRGKA